MLGGSGVLNAPLNSNMIKGIVYIYIHISRGGGSHKFGSGQHRHMKLHTTQLQHVLGLQINFQLNLTKNMEMPAVLKKGI